MEAICECGHEDDWHRRAPSVRICQHRRCDCQAMKLDANLSVMVAEHEALGQDREAFITGILAGRRRETKN